MNGCVLTFRRHILVCVIHTKSDAFRMFRRDFRAGDPPTANLNILVGGDVLCSRFQSRMAHVGMQGLHSLVAGNVPICVIFPVATEPMTLLAKLPPLLTDEE